MLTLPPFHSASARPGRPLSTLSLTLLLTITLMLGAAWAQGDGGASAPPGIAAHDPVLVQLGSTRERASFVMERFEIAVRGVASSQGMEYDTELLEQLYGFLPTFLDQRATELVLMDQARSRGIVVEESEIDAIVERVRTSLGDDGAGFERALAGAGFSSEAQLRVVVRETELVQRALASIRDAIVVTADEVTIAYHAQRLRFTSPAESCARHILVADEDRATAMLAELATGASFGDLARAESTDTGSAVRGGELGCLRQGVTVAPFDEAIFASDLAVDAFVGPVETTFGFHVIQVYEVRPSRVRPIAEVRAELEQELHQERAEAVLAAIVGSSGVEVFPQFIPPLEQGVSDAAGV
jgi:peptidyl-prolyl cis-trans isomerase C